MTTITLPLTQAGVDTARADHWAPRRRTERAARSEVNDTMRIEHWAARAAPAGAGTAQPQVDPWLDLGHAYDRVIADEPSLGRTLRARWSAWRERRAQARIEAEILAAAGSDERVLRELRIARDLAEWKIV